MSTQSEKNKNGCNGCNWLLIMYTFIMTIIFIIMVFVPALASINFTQAHCDLVNITYPTALPTVDNTAGWQECDCGRHCTAWTPCVNILVDTNNSTVIMSEDSTWSLTISTSVCTYYNSTCPDGEDVTQTQLYLEWAKEIAESIQLDNNFTCFTNGNMAYLSNEIPLGSVITVSTLFGLAVIISIAICIKSGCMTGECC